MSRREFSAKVKAQAALRCGCHCENCRTRLVAGDFHYDHDVPDGLGGEPTLENCRVLCRTCHRLKTTREDVPRMVKADAQRKRIALGIKPRRRSFQTNRDGPWKRKMSGEVVRR